MLIGIFATGRNGSTLLMRLLDGSPDLWVHPVEVNYLSVFSDLARFGQVRRRTSFNAIAEKLLALDTKLPAVLLIERFTAHIDEIEKEYLTRLAEPLELQGDPFAALGRQAGYAAGEFLPAFLERVRSACGGRAGKASLVFKSIETPYISEYAEVFPEMRFIHVVRHPFANFSSIKRSMAVKKGRPFWYLGGDELHTFLEMRWIPHARFILEARARENDRHYLVRYEDLCERPVEVVGDLCRWLKVRPPPDPTLLTVLGGRQTREDPVTPSQKGVRMPSRVVTDMSARFDYADVLSERERALIVFRTHRLARELGYFTPEERVRIPGRLGLAGRWMLPDRWELSNIRYGSRRYLLPRLALGLIRRRGWILGKVLFPFS